MKTLFGIRSNIAVVVVALIYLLVSLNTFISGINNFKTFISNDHIPRSSLFLKTDTNFFHIFTLILSLSCLLSSILLILGTIEKRHAILQPWLIVNFTLEVILTCGCFYLLYILIEVFHSSWSNVCGLILAISVNAIVVAFHDYLRTGIYYMYKRFQRESRRLYRVIDNEDNESIQLL